MNKAKSNQTRYPKDMIHKATVSSTDIPSAEKSNPESLRADNKLLNGRWTKEEHQRFVEALKLYGKNWKKVEEYVSTRSGAQIRSHAQKFFIRLEKDLKAKSQKGKNGKENIKSIRKISDASISTVHTQEGDLSDNEKAEDNLKENLPFHEENLNEASANTANLPLVKDSHLNTSEEPHQVIKEAVSEIPKETTSQAMQVEKSEENEEKYAKLSKAELLSRVISSEEKIKEFEEIVKRIIKLYETNHPNTTPNTTSAFRPVATSRIPPHESVYQELMNYFAQYNKTPKTLKLSDFINIAPKKYQEDENDYEFPVREKKVKQT